MNKFARAGVAALALVAASAPITGANAQPPPPPPATVNPTLVVVSGVWIIGFMLCSGLSVGHQDVVAAKTGTVVTGADRFRAFAACLLPPVGLAQLMK